ncbi:MAG: hypothetical protein H6Q15_1894 [Bacteroidetes bacterium]|nr:hypothetical protein [Bacteroidota bacterium]
MHELRNAEDFIKYFEKGYGKKIYRVPFLYNWNNVALLCCKVNNKYISLPYLSQGAIEHNPKSFDKVTSQNVEIRDIIPHSKYTYNEKVNFEMDLLDKDYIIPSNIRRKIEKAKKNGIFVYDNTSSINKKEYQKYINDFYFVYSRRMHKIGVPAISKKDILRRIDTKNYFIFVAYFNSKPIGAASLNKITEDYFENEYFATDSKYNYLYTSYALHNRMIEYSKQNNAKIYSFGRSTIYSKVYYFKKHWKVKEIKLVWSYTTKVKQLRNNKWFFKIWRSIPYKLSLLLGPIIHKRVY